MEPICKAIITQSNFTWDFFSHQIQQRISNKKNVDVCWIDFHTQWTLNMTVQNHHLFTKLNYKN
jgi:hypothetical protein